jgi:hypothetical protein
MTLHLMMQHYQILQLLEALNVTSPGISTFGGYVDINSDVDISGTLNVVGLSTFGGYVDINNSVDISNDLNVSGIGTIVTFNSTTGTITNLTNTNLNVTGIATIATLIATGVAVTNLQFIIIFLLLVLVLLVL